MKFAFGLIATVLAVFNVLFGVRLAYNLFRIDLPGVIGLVLLAVSILIPAVLAALAKLAFREARIGDRYLYSFAVVHVLAITACLYYTDLGLSDASLSFAQLTSSKYDPKKTVERPPEATDAATSAQPDATPATDSGSTTIVLHEETDGGAATDGGVYFRYEENGVVSYANSLDDVPLQVRATAVAVPMEARLATESGWSKATPRPEVPIGKPDSAWATKRLNAYRKVAAQKDVTLDPDLTRAAQAHADYIQKNYGHPSTHGLGVHKEKEGLPGYSKEGHEAGEKSVIVISSNLKEDAVSLWMASFYHRIPLILPTLSKIGYGYAQVKHGDRTLAIYVLHAGDKSGVRDRFVLYPRADQIDLPTHFRAEVPNPIAHDEDGKAGHPITVTFDDKLKVGSVAAYMEDAMANDVPVYLSAPESPALEGYQKNTICLIPYDPLQPKSTYEVTVSAIVQGEKWTKNWSFSTR